MTRTAAIGADELREDDTLLGDSICPARYGDGVAVAVVNVEFGVVMVLHSTGEAELLPAETVYVRRNG